MAPARVSCSSAENESASSDEQIDAMTRALFTAVYGGHVEIYLFPAAVCVRG